MGIFLNGLDQLGTGSTCSARVLWAALNFGIFQTRIHWGSNPFTMGHLWAILKVLVCVWFQLVWAHFEVMGNVV